MRELIMSSGIFTGLKQKVCLNLVPVDKMVINNYCLIGMKN